MAGRAVHIAEVNPEKSEPLGSDTEGIKKCTGCCTKKKVQQPLLYSRSSSIEGKKSQNTGLFGNTNKTVTVLAWLSDPEKARMIQFSETYAESG